MERFASRNGIAESFTTKPAMNRALPCERRRTVTFEAQDRMEAIEGIRRGLESMKRNAGKPAEKFFREFFAEQGISERE
jgi:hypothetical protein